MPTVALVPMGPVRAKVDLDAVVTTVSEVQDYYSFLRHPGVSTLGSPDKHSRELEHLPPDQYKAETLTEQLIEKVDYAAEVIVVGIVDAFIFDELFSVVEPGNRAILVSIKGNNITSLLEETGRSYEDYVMVECAAQLLTFRFRQITELSVPAVSCGDPWHTDLRLCLFDYYGLGSGDPRKLMHTELCDQCEELLLDNGVSRPAINSTLKMVSAAVRPKMKEALRRAASRPGTALALGAWLGAMVGLAAESASWFALTSTILLGWGFWSVYRELGSLSIE